MHRRLLLTLPLLALPFHPARAVPHGVAEVRAGVGGTRALRMQRRLGIPVRAVRHGVVEALDAGHLEVALLTPPELAEARRRMRDRLVVLPGRIEGRIPVTRQVLSAALRAELAAALA